MSYLVVATLVWAFSFSLIGTMLQGVDPYFCAFIRSLFALICFLPLARLQNFQRKRMGALFAIGGLQLGVMYCFYFSAFKYISVTEVLLFTIMTPFYVCLVRDLTHKKINIKAMGCALLSIFGAAIVRYNDINSDFIIGMLLIQGANLCFGIGQYAYSVIEKNNETKSQSFFAFYLGAAVISGLAYATIGTRPSPTPEQLALLAYLGFVASGLGYFLWNKGATKVTTASLAVMNQALIPAGIIVNLVFFDGKTDLIRLAIGGAIIGAAVYLSTYESKWQKKAGAAESA